MKTDLGIRRRDTVALALGLLVCMSTGLAQKSRKGDDQTNRSVQGMVTSAEDAPVVGAVVQLKNTKTLQIRSFITKEDGSYYFNGLSPDVDYELRADFQGMSSSTKTMSSFDSRKAVTINLKLNKK
jgi:Carboxypeptidase regulatory-like domain